MHLTGSEKASRGFRKGVSGVRRKADENLDILYVFVITIIDFL
jgi:hypothetical protein